MGNLGDYRMGVKMYLGDRRGVGSPDPTPATYSVG